MPITPAHPLSDAELREAIAALDRVLAADFPALTEGFLARFPAIEPETAGALRRHMARLAARRCCRRRHLAAILASRRPVWALHDQVGGDPEWSAALRACRRGFQAASRAGQI